MRRISRRKEKNMCRTLGKGNRKSLKKDRSNRRSLRRTDTGKIKASRVKMLQQIDFEYDFINL